ncbi:hypothetical protein [Streptosporangium sp. NPDC003464]
MSDQFRAFVSANYGAMNAGSGDQYVFMQLAQAAGKDPRGVADDQLAWLRQRFIPPGGFARACEVLESHGTVFLDGAPGAGRKAAAWMLLQELYSGTETFHEILLGEEGAPYLDLDTSQVGEGALLLVDLSAITSEQVWATVQDELPSFRKVVQSHTSRLVVVLPSGMIESLRADLGTYRIGITRPSAGAVFQRYLRAKDIPVAETDSAPEALSEFLARNPSMRGIADFATLVIEVRTTARSAGFAAWCDSALAVLDNKQSMRVTERLATLPQGPQRALLLATAMLHGARAEAIQRATASLLDIAEHPQNVLPLLEHADLTVRLKEINATADASGRVRFDEFGYDSAVRVHFWTHWPELREFIRKWVGNTVGLPGLETDDRNKLVERFARQCLQDRHRDQLLALVSQCAENPGNDVRMGAAVQALRQGLKHEEHGQFFRQKIREWASETSLSRGLAQVLVVTCWKVMAVHHPDQAMVRLHHLARKESGTTHARDALAQIVGADAQLRVWMLKRLVQRLQLGSEKWRQADARLFLEFADPVPLVTLGPRTRAPLSDPVVREELTVGWHVAFRRYPYETWRAQAERWIQAAFEDEQHCEHLLDVLVDGGEQRTALLAPLYVIARDLVPPSADGRERHAFLVSLVRRKINAALGFQAA